MSCLCGMVTVTGHPFFRAHLQATTRYTTHPWARRIATRKFGVKILHNNFFRWQPICHRNIVVIDLNLLGLFFLANIFSTSPRSLFFLCPGVRLEETCEQAPGEGSVTRREASGAGVGLLDSIYADPWYPNLVSRQATAFYFLLPRTGNFRGEFFMLTQPYG